MRSLIQCVLVSFSLLLSPVLYAQDKDTGESEHIKELRKLEWQVGPTEGKIADKAVIKVPEGYLFLDSKNTSRFLELSGNPPREGHYMFAPQTLKWFSVFSFKDSGYVKDDEKIDPDELLSQLKSSDSAGNKERERLGMEKIYSDGWEVAPYYDKQSNRLEWGLRIRGEDGQYGVNYTARLLGRTGVMSAVLVSSPESLAADAKDFKNALQQYAYVPGEKYAEFSAGDKVAEYGLAALVVGGAAAVATKKGFWGALGIFLAKFWKIIAVAVAGAAAGFKALFRRKE